MLRYPSLGNTAELDKGGTQAKFTWCEDTIIIPACKHGRHYSAVRFRLTQASHN